MGAHECSVDPSTSHGKHVVLENLNTAFRKDVFKIEQSNRFYY